MPKALLIPILALACSLPAFGLGSDYDVDRPMNFHKTPSGVNELIDDRNRVHGFFVNRDDRFFFAGDSSAFASFFQQYAELTGIAGHRLIIHPGKGVAKSPWDDGEGEEKYLVELHVWTESNVDIKKIKVPKDISVVHEERKSMRKKAPNK